ncbi:MAG: hypothetical protein GY853_01110 [PVC group bacterium]|nr:hypothetical protein [PVC group bacterium]
MKEKKTKLPTYREKRKEGSVKNFLGGEARKPYVLREDIVCGLKNRATQINGENENKNGRKYNSCICQEALGQFSDMFNNMIHTDQYLINKSSNQKGTAEKKKHIDIIRQNKWLLGNIFDSYGNYVYCSSCIKKIWLSGNLHCKMLK